MTKAEIITATRNLVNEISTDSGTLLSDTTNLLEFINDAMEQVVLDLIPIMPGQFLTSENVSLVSGTANYTPTTTFWMVYKVEKNVANDSPKEIHIIDPLEIQHYMDVGETDDEPMACYFLGNTIYFVPTPSATTANYAKLWLVRPEAATIPDTGPAYIPTPAHRLIVYGAATLVGTLLEANVAPFQNLYARRLQAVQSVWARRFQQRVRFVRPGVDERRAISSRDKAFYDVDW